MGSRDARGTLLIVSSQDHERLATLAREDGWTVAAARRADPHAALAAGAAVALIDARGEAAGSDGAGIAAVRALGGFAAATGGALVALIDRAGRARLDALHAAGATHFLAVHSRSKCENLA